MANWPSFTFAPRLRGGCLPFGEARGGVFARSELPHPCHVLLSLCKGNTFSFICKTQLYPKWKTPPASWCHSSSSSCCFRSCKCGLQGSGIHFLSSQIFSKSSRKRFDKMSFGATKKHRHTAVLFCFMLHGESGALAPPLSSVHLLKDKALLISLLIVYGCTSRCTRLSLVCCVSMSWFLRGAHCWGAWGERKQETGGPPVG